MLQGFKADGQKPYQCGVVDNVLEDLKTLVNFRPSTEDQMKSRIVASAVAGVPIDDEVAKVTQAIRV